MNNLQVVEKKGKKKYYNSYSELPATLTAIDVASVLNISETNAYKLIHTEDFPKIRYDGRFLVPKEKFISWVNKNSNSNYELSVESPSDKTKKELIKEILLQQDILSKFMAQQNIILQKLTGYFDE